MERRDGIEEAWLLTSTQNWNKGKTAYEDKNLALSCFYNQIGVLAANGYAPSSTEDLGYRKFVKLKNKQGDVCRVLLERITIVKKYAE